MLARALIVMAIAAGRTRGQWWVVIRHLIAWLTASQVAHPESLFASPGRGEISRPDLAHGAVGVAFTDERIAQLSRRLLVALFVIVCLCPC